MKNDLKIFLIDTVGWIVSICVIVFFFTLWLFSFNDVENALKESWSITFSALAAFTTIGAAIIAAYLFNDWKEQQKHQNSLQFGLDVYSNFKYFDESYRNLNSELNFLKFLLLQVLDENDENLRNKFFNDLKAVTAKKTELLNYFSTFHDSYINYCIVTNQLSLIKDLNETRETVLTVYDALTQAEFDHTLEHKLEYIEFLVSHPGKDVHTYIYNYYIKSIFMKVAL
ncbi:hypothetical protein F889_01523 [Acinetobacter colistiniresistens]|uniref:Uncharacterized protein n=1 Tax=Acinetobacter colistiniresistens TaxID=280145 RepID=N9PN08_9GAMM|nr:hypothetical protein [Acinetobacter colistiniresistens]ENX34883.1 hypothetical protein F889_01523 [Acinetobacter colistiniresistens]